MAPLSNVRRFTDMVARLVNRSAWEPGIGCFYGRAGAGKTTSSIFAMNTYAAYGVRVDFCTTQKGFCRKLMVELGLSDPRAKSIEQMVHLIGDHLADNASRPLIIDEADFLARRRIIEIVRDIYERSAPAGASIVLIGEPGLPRILEQWERVASRVSISVEALPITVADVGLLADLICPELEVSTEIAEEIRELTGGSARRGAMIMAALKTRARRERWARVETGVAKRALADQVTISTPAAGRNVVSLVPIDRADGGEG